MRRRLTAAAFIIGGLALVVSLAITTTARGGQEKIAHTCSATDKQFLKSATLNVTSLGTWGQSYVRGDATAKEVVAEARRAAMSLSRMNPTDPSLQKTRLLMGGMFLEYGRAIAAQAKNKDAGPHMFRAYGLANFAHDVLVQAGPELARRGCDVSSLL